MPFAVHHACARVGRDGSVHRFSVVIQIAAHEMARLRAIEAERRLYIGPSHRDGFSRPSGLGSGISSSLYPGLSMFIVGAWAALSNVSLVLWMQRLRHNLFSEATSVVVAGVEHENPVAKGSVHSPDRA